LVKRFVYGEFQECFSGFRIYRRAASRMRVFVAPALFQ
jgi:hypothetical protein